MRNCDLALLKIFNHELFGAIAEEKEVKQILSKVMEARRSKSYDSYEILGNFVGKDQVTKLILPLKEVRTWVQYKGSPKEPRRANLDIALDCDFRDGH